MPHFTPNERNSSGKTVKILHSPRIDTGFDIITNMSHFNQCLC